MLLPPLPGVRHRSVDVGDLPVHLAELGDPDAPPLLLLHGWPQHWWSWRRVAPLLADSYRVLMPDLRGHGWSGAPRTGYDKEQLATDLLGLLDALDLPRVQLVGHDWGGWTGFLACLRAPERFSSYLALSIPHPFQAPDARLLQAWRAAYQVPLSTPLLGRALLQTAPAAVERLIRAGSSVPGTFTQQDLRTYSRVLQEPARARASTLLYRTFLLQEAVPVWSGRYRAADLRVPTRLVAGRGRPRRPPRPAARLGRRRRAAARRRALPARGGAAGRGRRRAHPGARLASGGQARPALRQALQRPDGVRLLHPGPGGEPLDALDDDPVGRRDLAHDGRDRPARQQPDVDGLREQRRELLDRRRRPCCRRRTPCDRGRPGRAAPAVARVVRTGMPIPMSRGGSSRAVTCGFTRRRPSTVSSAGCCRTRARSPARR